MRSPRVVLFFHLFSLEDTVYLKSHTAQHSRPRRARFDLSLSLTSLKIAIVFFQGALLPRWYCEQPVEAREQVVLLTKSISVEKRREKMFVVFGGDSYAYSFTGVFLRLYVFERPRVDLFSLSTPLAWESVRPSGHVPQFVDRATPAVRGSRVGGI